MMAGLIVTFIGLCIVLIRLLRVPEHWVPLMVGVGLFLLGLVRWATRKES
jgi:Na+/H+ antiporter NhaD/arsenite permease-like protein